MIPSLRDNIMLSVDLTECKSSVVLWSQERMLIATIINNLSTEFSITVVTNSINQGIVALGVGRNLYNWQF
jgi:hypothetical protein